MTQYELIVRIASALALELDEVFVYRAREEDRQNPI